MRQTGGSAMKCVDNQKFPRRLEKKKPASLGCGTPNRSLQVGRRIARMLFAACPVRCGATVAESGRSQAQSPASSRLAWAALCNTFNDSRAVHE